MRFAILIPALDEEESLPGLLEELAPYVGAQVVVVDNASTDRTAEVAEAGGAVVLSEPQRGYGAACLRGIDWLSRQQPPPKVLVILDGDHADDPGVIGGLVERIEGDEADLVLTTRTWGGAEPGSMTPVQVWGNRVQTLGLQLRFGLVLTDMGPLRAIRWSSLQVLGMEDRTWGWNVEMACKAVRQGLRIVEVPVPYRRRQRGSSKISGSWQGASRAGARILWALWRYGA